jgi:DNA-directed RNA polymerase subunit RPC12/RpoP
MQQPIAARVRCPHCDSRLSVTETPSGGRQVSIVGFGVSVERSAKSLETFQGPGEGGDITCPACHRKIDPSITSRVPPLRRDDA